MAETSARNGSLREIMATEQDNHTPRGPQMQECFLICLKLDAARGCHRSLKPIRRRHARDAIDEHPRAQIRSRCWLRYMKDYCIRARLI